MPIADTSEAEQHDFADQAVRVAHTIRPLLSGLPYEVVGAVLGDLLATFVRSFYPPSIRDDVLGMHIEGVISLIQYMDKHDQSLRH